MSMANLRRQIIDVSIARDGSAVFLLSYSSETDYSVNGQLLI